jgi:predicted NUDIX family NTP pyrophosphohydrolase
LAVKITSDATCVLVFKKAKGDEDVLLCETYGPFDSWNEADAFSNGLQLGKYERAVTAVLRNPALPVGNPR